MQAQYVPMAPGSPHTLLSQQQPGTMMQQQQSGPFSMQQQAPMAPRPMAVDLGPPMGFSTEKTSEDDCLVCGDYNSACCNFPIYFCTMDRAYSAEPAEMKRSLCSATQEMRIDNAKILGTSASFHFQRAMCPCSDSTMTVNEGNRVVGTVVYHPRGCGDCGEFTAVESFDSSGRPRFARREPGCYDGRVYNHWDCCGYTEIAWPISGYQNQQTLGWLNYRYHSMCYMNYPQWMGYKAWPMTTGNKDDQLLLLGFALVRWINLTSQKKQQRQQGGGGMMGMGRM